MTKVAHQGHDHSMLLPRPEEVESWERLDRLLADINRGDRHDRTDRVVAHAATLFAGIESPPALGAWPIGQRSSDTSARWIEMVLGIEIDRTILRILQNEGTCVDCLIAWVRHLIESRITLSDWAWTRDADDLLR
jgi:hypothetical protein